MQANKGAGRLWASLVQLVHQCVYGCEVMRRAAGPVRAMIVFLRALQFVAKSGEVWCEGARLFLNPCSPLFSLQNARYCLNLAVFFTPQYGDSFIEVVSLAGDEA